MQPEGSETKPTEPNQSLEPISCNVTSPAEQALVPLHSWLILSVSQKMIHGFPGMGADSRMYPSPWNTLPDYIVHDWPCYERELSIADVARRMVDKYSIRDGDALVGTSLGGIVACEVAKLRKIETLFLIGSAKSKDDVNSFLSILKQN